MDLDAALDALVRWAEGRDDVRTLVLAGSAAAGAEHPLSDRDLEVYATDPAALLADESWWSSLGEVLVVERLENPGWHPTRLVHYVDGKLDLLVAPAGAEASEPRDRPYRLLVDKDDVAGAMLAPTLDAAPAPTAEAIDEVLQEAWAAALMCAKACVRDELWMAKVRDRDLKAGLLAVIEWEHRARRGADLDVRYLGVRWREWMDADVQAALLDCWGRFDAADAGRALRATCDLLATTAQRLSAATGLPTLDAAPVRAEIDRILALAD